MGKIKILFYNESIGGINYYRTQTPAIELERLDNSRFFHIEIINSLDFTNEKTIDYLKSFDIIHYHKQLVPYTVMSGKIMDSIKKSKTKLFLDIDDYWILNKNHPNYSKANKNNHKEMVLYNIQNADYVSTTTELFADEIRKITNKDNVVVFENAINPEWMKQFHNNWKKDPNDLVRITYMGGSSHLYDLKQLENVVNILNSDPQTKNKFKIILAGWDGSGEAIELVFNESLKNELDNLGLWNREIIQQINKSNGRAEKIKLMPNHLKDKYKNNVFVEKRRDIRTEESIYFDYEKILTNNHKLIQDDSYYRWLMMFEINGVYPNEHNFGRRWTKGPNNYAYVLDETDIVLAPLENNKFNSFKSELKQTECWTRKLPVVCSDLPPYNIYGKHMENCILIPDKKNNKKHWAKNLKKLILDKDLRNKIGEGLYNDFKDRFHLTNVTKKRRDFYKKILNV